ncbi:MAG: hypothetical protein GY861_21210 [bacterium]|nr:hypothetical protein [bacterium]
MLNYSELIKIPFVGGVDCSVSCRTKRSCKIACMETPCTPSVQEAKILMKKYGYDSLSGSIYHVGYLDSYISVLSPRFKDGACIFYDKDSGNCVVHGEHKPFEGRVAVCYVTSRESMDIDKVIFDNWEADHGALLMEWSLLKYGNLADQIG